MSRRLQFEALPPAEEKDAETLYREGVESLEEIRHLLSQKEYEEAMASLLATYEAMTATAPESEEEAHRRHVEEVTSMDLPLDFENCFADDERVAGVHADGVADGLILSLHNLGRVDVEYISSVTGVGCKEVILALKGSIFQNPLTWGECFYRGWETREEYLSGNLMRKWREAKKANEEYLGYFADNLTALEEAMPEGVTGDDIYVTLGSPWVPPDVIDDFMEHLFGVVYKGAKRKFYGVRYSDTTGIWEIPEPRRYRYTPGAVKVTTTWGTRRMDGITILERTLNMRSVTVYDEENVSPYSRFPSKRRRLNEEETVLAIEKQNRMIEEFRRWVWSDGERKARLEEIYDNRYGCVKTRKFDGSFLTFPGLAEGMELYPYQKNAVARIIFTPNTLLAHDVGSGKTYIMVAAGMELARIGISPKNLYVLPNSLVGQWRDIFKSMYPASRVLTVTPGQFTPARRAATLMEMRDGEFDAILIASSCFDAIPLSRQYYVNELKDELARLKAARKESYSDTEIRRRERACRDKIEELESGAPSDAVTFDDLGITTLFVDEAHNYKNVPLETKIEQVLGLSSQGSEKCLAMMEKVKSVQKANGGRGVVMATGTPITNSITDAYVMQKYLQSGELSLLGLGHFDSWVGMFAEKAVEFEVDIDTSRFRMATRFSRFHNLPELTALFASVADFHKVGAKEGVPHFGGYTDISVPRSPQFEAYLKVISKRAEDVRRGRVALDEDNMLLITNDGRKAALDLRLVGERVDGRLPSKISSCAAEILRLYKETEQTRAAQLVFCDTSTPKKEFNCYDELFKALRAGGIPEEEIAFVHDATTERRRDALFAAVQKGRVRVLIGSTFKLGMGVNVQERLIAVHHLDVPWRPADMVQREGRILRQGNTNPLVHIFRYITVGSFDAYSWQLLETKQGFISQLLSGTLEKRDGGDVDEAVLNYAEIKALAIGNPLIKKRVKLANELGRLQLLHREWVEERERMERERDRLPDRIEKLKEQVKNAECDLQDYKKEWRLYPEGEYRALAYGLGVALREYAMRETETGIGTYQGFEIRVPAHMFSEDPSVWLTRRGRYHVRPENTRTSMLDAIEEYLAAFGDHVKKLRGQIPILEESLANLNEALSAEGGHQDRITEITEELEKIDERLGVQRQ